MRTILEIHEDGMGIPPTRLPYSLHLISLITNTRARSRASMTALILSRAGFGKQGIEDRKEWKNAKNKRRCTTSPTKAWRLKDRFMAGMHMKFSTLDVVSPCYIQVGDCALCSSGYSLSLYLSPIYLKFDFETMKKVSKVRFVLNEQFYLNGRNGFNLATLLPILVWLPYGQTGPFPPSPIQ